MSAVNVNILDRLSPLILPASAWQHFAAMLAAPYNLTYVSRRIKEKYIYVNNILKIKYNLVSRHFPRAPRRGAEIHA